MPATVKVRDKQKPVFGPETLEAIAPVGDIVEFRFKLRQVKLADGEYHQLSKPVTARVKWATEYFVALDNKTTFTGAGATPDVALQEYLDDWCTRFRRLEEEEPLLGPGLSGQLHNLRVILGLTRLHAA